MGRAMVSCSFCLQFDTGLFVDFDQFSFLFRDVSANDRRSKAMRHVVKAMRIFATWAVCALFYSSQGISTKSLDNFLRKSKVMGMRQVSVTLNVPEAVDKLVKKDAKRLGFSRSVWIRRAIADKLTEIERRKEATMCEVPY